MLTSKFASLKELSKKRILQDMIGSVRTPEGYVVMVVDKWTLRILSAACGMSDIADVGVTVVEKLEIQRQRLPEMEALYFISPEADSVDALVRDFSSAKKPQYRAVHLFFSTSANQVVMNKLAQAPHLIPLLKTMKDMNLDFIASQPNVFHTDSPHAVQFLYSPDALGAARIEQLRTAEKIVTLCTTMKEFPHIRYSIKHPMCEHVARYIHQQLDGFYRTSIESFDVNAARPTMVIMDRSIDPLAPVLHESTYEAMIHDLLHTKEDNIVEYTTVKADGTEEVKRAVVTEKDELWVGLRHQHIAVVLETVAKEFSNFVKGNVSSKLHKQLVNGPGSEVDDPRQMLDAIRAMPQYTELLDRYGLHMQLAEKCVNVFNEKNLQKIMELEQDLATGVDKEGRILSNGKFASSLAKMLSRGDIGEEEKLRLVLSYVIAMEGVKEKERKRIVEVAQLTPESQRAVQNLLFIGVNPQVAGKAHKRIINKDELKKAKKRAKDVPFELMRSVPVVKDVMETQLNGSMPIEQFPYVVTPPEILIGEPLSQPVPATQGRSLRTKKRYDWHIATEEKKEVELEAEHPPRSFFFVLGGITHSEARSAFELSNQFNREVIIGGSCLLTPQSYIDELKGFPSGESTQVVIHHPIKLNPVRQATSVAPKP
eukprot:GILK01009998.1.p1 GENE.GILK01009998.1~~GILK01009998.1.p1  ORF type:complete len:654 (+),score=153.21 GILK01009998.1:211-2172(+)